jgi:alpha-L-rhamnosidase
MRLQLRSKVFNASRISGVVAATLMASFSAHAQMTAPAPGAADPVADAAGAPLERDLHQPLPEQYVWTAPEHATTDRIAYVFPGLNEKTEPHYFRASFLVGSAPPHATLYVAGPRSAEIYLNGKLVDHVETDVTHPITMHTFAVPVESVLHTGVNTLALKVVRGRGVTGFTNSALLIQETSGQVVVAKIVARPPYLDGPAIMMSGPAWKSTTAQATGWEQPGFDDAAWKPVQTLGGIEHTQEEFQWNADAGLYDWPGYDGISPFLAHRRIPVTTILSSSTGRSTWQDLEQITSASPSAPFAIRLSAPVLEPASAPTIILDFGREITARLELVSASDSYAKVVMQYGESYDEMLKNPYLGVNELTIAPHATAHGPKSSFRYAKIGFVAGAPDLAFTSIAADDIFYPVTYKGSFESSDPLLNRIWAVGAYTAHLCMQDDIWDSPKRDRGRWMGDTDVMGRTIEDAFADRFLMRDTLDRLLGPAPVEQHVNGIPGYSAFWFTGTAQYIRQTGDIEWLRGTHERMLQLLAYVDREFDTDGVYANKTNVWLYVDWSPQLNGDTPESRRATTLEFYAAYRDAAFLLRALGDTANAEKYEQRASAVKAAAQEHLLDTTLGSFGTRWQTNAMAVLSGVADPSQYNAIWSQSLASVGHVKYNALVTTPYYGYYILAAMAKMNHRQDALNWMRQYWGGMIRENATSFWEAYDPDWFKEDFHASLQADNRSGYFVSLAHGWSTGAMPWLMENVLGIQSTGPGFSTVTIRPDLLDLTYAHGTEPTPRGLLGVDVRPGVITIDLPAGTEAKVLIPLPHPDARVAVNGVAVAGTQEEGGTRLALTLQSYGHFVFTTH